MTIALIMLVLVTIGLGCVVGYLWGLLTQPSAGPAARVAQIWLDALGAAQHIQAAAWQTEQAMAVPTPPVPRSPGS